MGEQAERASKWRRTGTVGVVVLLAAAILGMSCWLLENQTPPPLEKVERPPEPPFFPYLYSVACSNSGGKIAMGGWGPSILVLDRESERYTNISFDETCSEHSPDWAVFSLAWNSDETTLIAGTWDRINIWDNPPSKPKSAPTLGIVESVGFLSDGTIWSFSCHKGFLVYRRDGVVVRTFSVPHWESSSGLMFGPWQFIGGGKWGDLHIADFGRSIFFKEFHQGQIRAVAYSPKHKILFTGSQDYSIKALDLETFQSWPLQMEPVAHKEEILSMVLSQDEQYLATTDTDGEVLVTNIAEIRKRRLTQALAYRHEYAIKGIAFLGPEKKLVLGLTGDAAILDIERRRIQLVSDMIKNWRQITLP